MEFRLSRMTLQGKVAVTNLLLIACCVKITMADILPWGGWADHAVSFVLSALSFPIGWLSLLARDRLTSLLTLGVYIPANAYLWGFLVAELSKWRRQRKPGQHLMEFHLWRLTLQGKIAMGILSVIGVLLAVARIIYPAHYIYSAGSLYESDILSTPIGWGIAVLTFPLGWISEDVCDIDTNFWTIGMTALLIMLNAYLWGFFVAAIVRRCNRGKSDQANSE